MTKKNESWCGVKEFRFDWDFSLRHLKTKRVLGLSVSHEVIVLVSPKVYIWFYVTINKVHYQEKLSSITGSHYVYHVLTNPISCSIFQGNYGIFIPFLCGLGHKLLCSDRVWYWERIVERNLDIKVVQTRKCATLAQWHRSVNWDCTCVFLFACMLVGA